MKEKLREVEKALAKLPLRASAQNPESYIGGGQSKLRYLGLRVPQLHQAMREGFSFFNESEVQIAKVWNYVWQESDCYEVMALALDWFYQPKRRAALVQHWPMLKQWSGRIDNWAHSDTLSGIYARILENEPKQCYPTLEEWNEANNPWLRRLSLVSLLYYSSQREKVLPVGKILPLVQAQLDHEHYYVQKGVGWALRETGNVYPKETYLFLEKHIQVLSAAAFSAATEKLSKEKKIRLKMLRKMK